MIPKQGSKILLNLHKDPSNKLMAYLILKHIIPGPATQYISDKELEKIKRDVEDDTVDPNDTSPSPTDTMDLRKAPIGIHSNHRSNLI